MNRKNVIISAVLMLVAIAVLGQVILAAGQRAGACGKGRLLQSLNLTDAQKAQVKSIFQDAKTKVQAVRNDKSLTPDQQKTQIRGIFKAAKEQVEQVLTPEQKQKLAQERKEMRGQGIRRVLAALNLTDAQKTQVKAIFEDAKTKAEAVHNDKSLTPDQQKAQMMEIRKAAFGQVKQVLTPEQQQKLQDIMAKHCHGARQAK
jgi:Spy/CpxP family protein refolding chaperone